MSEEYRINAIGRADFVLPFGLTGFDYNMIDNQSDAIKFIRRARAEKTVYIIDEDILEEIEKIEELENSGVNILILKGWGHSAIAGKKIQNASIKAMGIDLAKDE